ncbi:MAG TPA: hypothetical protein DD490_16270 [Acidobacteria bacterium]|nr:hypothetical protein [Acidobacteriota bacterium]
MSQHPPSFIGVPGSREAAVEAIRKFLHDNHRGYSCNVFGVAMIGKSETVTAAIEKAKGRKKIAVFPNDHIQPLSLERLYETIRTWSEWGRRSPRAMELTRFPDYKTPLDFLSEINKMLDWLNPSEAVVLRIHISEAVDMSSQRLAEILRAATNGGSPSRKMILEMRRRLSAVFFSDAGLHATPVAIRGLYTAEAEKLVFDQLAGDCGAAKAALVASAGRRWCGRHPGLLKAFVGGAKDFCDRIRAADLSEIRPSFFSELFDGELSSLAGDVSAILGTLSEQAREQVYEPLPDDHVLHSDLASSGLTCGDRRQLPLLVRRVCQKLRIFISYASEDRERVEEDVVASLSTVSLFKVTWDRNRDILSPGDGWEELLLEKVKACDAFLFVSTGASRKKLGEDGMLRREYDLGRSRKDRLLIPVVFGRAEVPVKVPEEISSWQGANLPDDLDSLVERLKKKREELWRSFADR